MSRLLNAIRTQYGLKLPPMPTEFKQYRFAIDDMRVGFAIPVGRGLGFFGCVLDGEAWAVEASGVHPVSLEVRDSEAIRYERLIYEMGKAAPELSSEDQDRLRLAAGRLSEWL